MCVEVPLFLFCGIKQEDAEAIKKKEKVFSTLGLTYAEFEGYLQQKAIATLFFEVNHLSIYLYCNSCQCGYESLPQLVVQVPHSQSFLHFHPILVFIKSFLKMK